MKKKKVVVLSLWVETYLSFPFHQKGNLHCRNNTIISRIKYLFDFYNYDQQE